MPSVRRLSPPPPFVFVLAVALAASLVPPATAKETFPIELSVQSEARAQLAGAAVSIRAESGKPFAVQGVTDMRGQFATKLPDFSRVYEIRVTLDGFVDFVQSLDLAAQNLQPAATAQITVTLPEEDIARRLYNEGVVFLQKDDLKQAREKLLSATQKNPRLGEAWRALAIIGADEKNWEEVLDFSDRALGFLGPDPVVEERKYNALLGLERREEAMVLLEQMATRHPSPETAKLLFNQGAAALTEGLLGAAKNRFIQAFVMDSTLYQAHNGLAEVLIREKNYQGALDELDVALNLAPSDKKIAGRRIEVLRALGRAEEAAEAEKKLAEPDE